MSQFTCRADQVRAREVTVVDRAGCSPQRHVGVIASGWGYYAAVHRDDSHGSIDLYSKIT